MAEFEESSVIQFRHQLFSAYNSQTNVVYYYAANTAYKCTLNDIILEQ